jgi:hypothetical protein
VNVKHSPTSSFATLATRVTAIALLVLAAGGTMSRAHAQQTAAEPPRANQAVLARWVDLQAAALGFRHRHADNSRGVVTTNQLQHREALRARLKADAAGHYALNFGVSTGPRFTSSWDNTPWGINDGQANVAFRVLYAAAQPIDGVEVDIGGLGFARGESTEITGYDDDGYVTGARLTLRRPAQLFFDEASITTAYFTSAPEQVSIGRRLRHLGDSNYRQFLLAKRLTTRAVVSGDYTIETGRRTWREAVNLSLPELRIVDSLVFENYQRTNVRRAYGFAVTGTKTVHRRLTLGGGYARVDPDHGSLNGDRFNIGPHVFAMATFLVSPQLAASAFATTTAGRHGALPQRSMTTVALSYNVLPELRRTKLF